jgi:hypothetical protein
MLRVESVTIGSRFGGETAPTRGQPLAEPDGEDRPPPLSFYAVENRRPLSLHVQGRREERTRSRGLHS